MNTDSLNKNKSFVTTPKRRFGKFYSLTRAEHQNGKYRRGTEVRGRDPYNSLKRLETLDLLPTYRTFQNNFA